MIELASLRLGFAFSVGAATFFAPCAFPLLPGYVAFFLGREDETAATAGKKSQLRRGLVVAGLTSLGFLVVYVLLGGIVLYFGSRIVGSISVLELVVGGLLLVVGTLMALGRTPTAALHVRLPERRRSPVGYVGFGVVYATAAAGCTAPLFVGIASIALASGPVGAVATIGAYAAGMILLLFGVTILTALGRGAVVSRLSPEPGRITRVAGVVLVVAGVVQLYWYVVIFDGLAGITG